MFGFSPIVAATIQSTIISFCSCLVALFLTPDRPPHISSLLLYSILATPPNFWWQQFIESKFPAYALQRVEVDEGGKGVEVEKKLNVQNTCIKVLLDQTVAAVVNVAGYIGVTRLLKGVPLGLCWKAVKNVRWLLPTTGRYVLMAVCGSKHGPLCLLGTSYGQQSVWFSMFWSQ